MEHEMKPTEQILLEILRDNGTVKSKNGVRSLNSSAWEELVLIAEKSGLFAILYKRLLKLKPDNLPPAILSDLKTKYFLNLQRNGLLEKELLETISCFAQKGIKAVPLKGPVLASYLYQDIGMRRASCDLDILIRKEQLTAAEELLRGHGYTPAAGQKEKRLRDYDLKYSGQLVFQREPAKDMAYIIELHANLRGEFSPAPLEYFWSSLREITINKNTLLFPNNEALLIYLCLAAMTITEFTELRYIYDIHSLISGHDINWILLEGILKNTRYKDAVFFALRLSNELFGSRVPNGILIKIRPNWAKRRFLSLWINTNNVMRAREASHFSWYYFFTIWYYFASSYLYARSILESSKISARKIFIPCADMALLYGNKQSPLPFSFYVKRILKPLIYLLKNR
jgi:hypothetical protein